MWFFSRAFSEKRFNIGAFVTKRAKRPSSESIQVRHQQQLRFAMKHELHVCTNMLCIETVQAVYNKTNRFLSIMLCLCFNTNVKFMVLFAWKRQALNYSSDIETFCIGNKTRYNALENCAWHVRLYMASCQLKLLKKNVHICTAWPSYLVTQVRQGAIYDIRCQYFHQHLQHDT